MNSALSHVADHFDDFVVDLRSFLKIPSISTLPEYRADVRRCAGWLADHLKGIGIAGVEIVETTGHPLVLASHAIDHRLPTVLVYGHYDVQPAGSLADWHSEPFDPVLRDGALYARGASDDKGQLFAILKAIEAWMRRDGLPVNLKLVLEGEEEVGSSGVQEFIRGSADRLAADVALICDTSMPSAALPAITCGLRGIAYCELAINGAMRDSHSGDYGGALENPLHVLGRLIASLHDADRQVAVPGFYDAVDAVSPQMRETIRGVPFDETDWLENVGARCAVTETGYTPREATTVRPAIDLHGVWGGFSGPGLMSIVPASAGAKLSARLVGGQTADDIYHALERHFDSLTPPSLDVRLRLLGGCEPVTVKTDRPVVRCAARALRRVFGRDPAFLYEGGSIPVVSTLTKTLEVDCVLMGFGLGSDAIHSANEHFGLDRLRRGIESVVCFLEELARDHLKSELARWPAPTHRM